MKKIIIAMIFILLAANAWGEGTGNINFILGQKQLSEDDWEPLENHGEFGVMFDYREKDWTVNLTIDYLMSGKKDSLTGTINNDVVTLDLEGSTTELDIGARKIWEIAGSSIRPFIGGGVAIITAEYKGSLSGVSVSDEDTGFGMWVNGGVYWTLSKHFNLGMEIRHSSAEVTLFDSTGQAGGFHNSLFLGYHW